MAAPVLTRLGPADHGRRLTFKEFMAGPYEPGYRYELIDGRLYVVTAPNFQHSWARMYLFKKLLAYVALWPRYLNHVVVDARVHVPGAVRVTCPEPDIAGYRDFPLDRLTTVQWEDVSPILVGEVLSPDDPATDLVRNRDLYWRVPSIKEYWVLDILKDAARPTLLVHRRWGGQWRLRTVGFGETYTTRLLPHFALLVDPRA